MKQALKMTLQSASNPFGGVPPARLLRTFQALSKDYTSQIQKRYAIPVNDVTIVDLEQLESLISELHALTQVFREVGNRLNPFQNEDDHKPIDWITFHDYQEMVDFYLNVALPELPCQDFYGWLCHDMIEQAHQLSGMSHYLLIMARQQKLDQKTYDEMANHTALWKFEALADAAAEFERQQFGELECDS